MALVVMQRISNGSMVRAGRRLADRLHLRWTLTQEERANFYVSQMPIAVVGASLGARPSDVGNRR